MELLAEKQSTTDLLDMAAQLGAEIAEKVGSLLAVVGELDRRDGFRAEGATSMAAWLTERLGVSDATARAWTEVAQKLWDLPHLFEGLRSGVISFDKVRLAAGVSTPETDADVTRQAQECSVRQLTDLARAARGSSDADADSHYDARYLRFNDKRRTVTAQLPEDHYAQVRSTLSAIAGGFPTDGSTPYDQRLCDALVYLCQPDVGHTERNTLVVLHADFSMLRGGSGTAELERLGLVSREAARRLACDADVVLALDDAFGHTMVEGRSRRFPTPAQRREVRRRDRHCRFPGCSNDVFTEVHHIVQWIDGGLTDLDNLALLCDHHHHRVHEGKWTISGDGNGTLRFLGPTKRLMTSRPSPLWTRRN